MKHLSIILCALLLVGCECNSTKITNVPDIKCEAKFKYNGHDYLLFKYHRYNGQGVVHDPDCRKCMQAYD